MRAFRASKGVVLSFTLAALACGGAPEGATSERSSPLLRSPAYLSLGDSVPFGYDPTRLPPLAAPPKTSNVFVGYPTYLDAAINDVLTNPTCPGETSASFMIAGALDRGCQAFKTDFDLLHVSYAGTQQDFALAFLASHPETKLITLTIGANDALLVAQSCADPACIVNGLEPTVRNVAAILTTLRHASPGAQIILTLYYAPSLDPGILFLTDALNSALSQAVTRAGAGVVTVNLKAAFDAADASFGGDPCKAGLLVRFPDGTCDIHPSQTGQKLIARTIRPMVL
ncbi:MAG TPA: SGNH/GDSL hydrolase family protein [Anaeromyxobacteraceae bacterium]|nr:SGNH/GDSL hydrolase family protein [Anaeromyxobacteraceae bacterium]